MLVLNIFDQGGVQDEHPSPIRGLLEEHPSPSSPEDKETNLKKRRGASQEELAVGYGRVRSKGQCTLNRSSPEAEGSSSPAPRAAEGSTAAPITWPRWRSPLVRHSSSSEENEQVETPAPPPAEETKPQVPSRSPPPPPPPAAATRREPEQSAAPETAKQQQPQQRESQVSPSTAATWSPQWKKREEVEDCTTASARRNLDKDFQARDMWLRKPAEADFHAPQEAAAWEPAQAQACQGQQELQNQQELRGQPGLWGKAPDQASEQWYDKALWEHAEDFNPCHHANWHKSGWSEPPQEIQSSEVNWAGPEELQPQQGWPVWCENDQELHTDMNWAGWFANPAEVQGHDASWRADGSQQHPSTWPTGEQPSDVGATSDFPRPEETAGYAKPLPKTTSGGWYDDPGHIQSSGNGWFGSQQQDSQTMPGWGESGAEDFYRHQLSWS